MLPVEKKTHIPLFPSILKQRFFGVEQTLRKMCIFI